MDQPAAPIVEFRDISKKFGAFYANRDINLSIREGEVHAIAGENGAGKTTLMNVLFGRVRPESGSVLLRGKPVWLRSPRDAIRAGIGMVHQNPLFFPQLSVLENIIPGSEHSRFGVIQKTRSEMEFLHLRDAFGFEIDPAAQAGELSFAGRQQIELMRALYRGARILILDEPTSFLGPHEVEKFLEMLRSFRAGGRTVIFISHRLEEVFAVSDRITVLRRGTVVATLDSDMTGKGEIARLMIGAAEQGAGAGGHGNGAGERVSAEEGAKTGAVHLEDLAAGDPRHRSGRGKGREVDRAGSAAPVLELINLCVEPAIAEPRIENLSLSVGEGEIIGIAGVVGNGQRLLARAISGRAAAASGQIFLDGSDITALGVDGRLRAGIFRVPEDPSGEALLPEKPIWENFLIGRQRETEFQGRGILRKKEIFKFAGDQIGENGIAARSAFQPLKNLSGGNRQKAALARLFSSRPRVAVIEQPSHGLDLHASARIMERIAFLGEQGTAVIILSYDLDELISICDRISVIFRGRIIATADRETASREVLGKWMVGIDRPGG